MGGGLPVALFCPLAVGIHPPLCLVCPLYRGNKILIYLYNSLYSYAKA
ncbi:hypothetical protein KL86PLE_100326 [uncultured Pleomorphomonas sp.]|uniref:Uncharacterized protein n=1 Tax=uncultured Pleomorphomonas sp. TaxID=442121 RepID=A0A212L2J4_9HYPH|nr:hypothetical protein KL86PLE_100326 [uncultured Pleomorphomonas sp.]